MSVRVTRTITFVALFAIVAMVYVDSASAQLFKRHRLRGNHCCAAETSCCTSSRHHRRRGMGRNYGSSGGSQGGMYGQYSMNSAVDSYHETTGSQDVHQGCCGSTHVMSQNYGTPGYNPQSFSQGQYQDQNFVHPNSIQLFEQDVRDSNQGSTETNYRLDSTTNLNNPSRLNPIQGQSNNTGNYDSNRSINLQNNGTIRNDSSRNSDGSWRGNSDLNLDGTIRDRNSNSVEQRNSFNISGRRQN